jgi:D-serine deaminase-like pyridoxal phosphate-dependent protein
LGAAHEAAANSTAHNSAAAVVGYVEYLGNFTKGEVRIADSFDLEFEHYHLSSEAHKRRIAVGDRVRCTIDPEDIILGMGIRGLE